MNIARSIFAAIGVCCVSLSGADPGDEWLVLSWTGNPLTARMWDYVEGSGTATNPRVLATSNGLIHGLDYAANGTLYAAATFNINKLYTVHEPTAGLTEVISIPGTSEGDMAYDVSQNRLLISEGPFSNDIYQVHLSNGNALSLFNSHGRDDFSGVAADSQGNIWAVDGHTNSTQIPELLEWNGTGWLSYGSLGFFGGVNLGMDFDTQDRLHILANDGKLYRIDLTFGTPQVQMIDVISNTMGGGYVALVSKRGQPRSAAPEGYVIGLDTVGNVYRIDSGHGKGELIGSSGQSNCTGMAYVGGEYLALMNFPPSIFLIDPNTGAATPSGIPDPGGDIRALSHGPNGWLFAVRDGGSPTSNDILLQYTASTGWTVKGSIGFTSVEGLTYHPSNTLYGWDTIAGLISLSTFNGVGVDVNPSVGATAQIRSLDVGYGGKMYGVEHQLYEISGSGIPTLKGSGGYTSIRGIAFDPTLLIGHYMTPTGVKLARVSRIDGSTTSTGASSLMQVAGSGAYRSTLSPTTFGAERFTSWGVGMGGAYFGLFSVNPMTAQNPSVVETTEVISGLAWNPIDDRLYGLTSGALLKQNGVTGSFTSFPLSGSVGAFNASSLACDSIGQLYTWAPNIGLTRVNSNGTYVDVSALGTTVMMEGLDFAPDGQLFGVTDKLFKIDKTTGSASPVGGYPVADFRDITFGRKVYDTNASAAATSPIVSGTVAGLGTDGDNSTLTIRPGAVIVSSQYPGFVEVNLPVVGHNPARLVLRYHRRASAPNIRERIKLWVPSLGSWVNLDPPGFMPMTMSGAHFLLVAAHIYPNNPTVTVRIEFKAEGSVLIYPWTVTLDRLDLEYIP